MSKKRYLAGGVGAALLLSLAIPAFASEAPIIDSWTAEPSRTGSLTITKLLNDGDAPYANHGGGEQSLDNTGVEGADILVCRLTDTWISDQYELVTGLSNGSWTVADSEWWQIAAALTVTDLPALPTADPWNSAEEYTDCSVKTTNSSGVAVWDGEESAGIPLGLYRASEIATPSGNTRFQDFLVTVPLTTGDGGDGLAWNYDVYVYPKSDELDFNKDIFNNIEDDWKTDAKSFTNSGNPAHGTKVGDEVTFRIVAKAAPGSDLDKYTITDTLEARLDFPTHSSDGVTTWSPENDVQVLFMTTDGAEFTAWTGETLTVTTDYTAVRSGQVLTIDFTATGLTKIAAAAAAEHDETTPEVVYVVVVFNAVANQMGADSDFVPATCFDGETPYAWVNEDAYHNEANCPEPLTFTAATGGRILNYAELTYSNDGVEIDDPMWDTAGLNLYAETILKRSTDLSLNGGDLSGAEFVLFASQGDAEAFYAGYTPATEATCSEEWVESSVGANDAANHAEENCPTGTGATYTAAVPASNTSGISPLEFYTGSLNSGDYLIEWGTKVSSVETDANGVAIVAGLAGAASTDGSEYPLNATYYAVETKALPGHELLPEPFAVVLDTLIPSLNGTVTNNETGALVAADFTRVVNVPHNAGFDLPLTGATGTAIFTILGLGGATVAYTVATRRAKRATATVA